jgi:hypothetical protein
LAEDIVQGTAGPGGDLLRQTWRIDAADGGDEFILETFSSRVKIRVGPAGAVHAFARL